MGFPLPETGEVTEDVGVVGGLLSAGGDANILFVDDTGAWTAETIAGAYGSQLVIDADGVWTYTATNAHSAIQDLDTGETLTEVFTISSSSGDTTVTITIHGQDEPPCFVRGTMIDTPQGARAIETLSEGDMVLTTDAGAQPIRWIGSKTVSPATFPEYEAVRPIRIVKDCFGPGVPLQDLLVSPMHRMLLRGAQPLLLFGQKEVLCAAKMLINGQTIFKDPAPEVEYFHLLFDHHQVIVANGCAAESFLAGNVGLSNFDAKSQEQVFALFPELRSLPNSYGPAARRILRHYEAGLMHGQHLRDESFLRDGPSRVHQKA